MSELEDLARAANSPKRPPPMQRPIEYKTPQAPPKKEKTLYWIGFEWGLGFFSAGLIFSIIVAFSTLILSSLLVASCTAAANKTFNSQNPSGPRLPL